VNNDAGTFPAKDVRSFPTRVANVYSQPAILEKSS